MLGRSECAILLTANFLDYFQTYTHIFGTSERFYNILKRFKNFLVPYGKF